MTMMRAAIAEARVLDSWALLDHDVPPAGHLSILLRASELPESSTDLR